MKSDDRPKIEFGTSSLFLWPVLDEYKGINLFLLENCYIVKL